MSIFLFLIHPYEFGNNYPRNMVSTKKAFFRLGKGDEAAGRTERQKKLCTAAKANNSKQGRPWTETLNRGPPDFRRCCCCLGRSTGERNLSPFWLLLLL